MRRWISSVAAWLEKRLDLRGTLLPILTHPVPRGVNWWYVFGSATLTMLLLQVITGICLAMVYVPSADEAYASLEYLNYQQNLGWLLRALHYFGASGMVVMMAVHMIQVFLWAAYKYPRELTWLAGTVLFFLTLGMGFSGQVLRWDTDAYWGVGVMVSMAGRTPFIGPQVVDTILGGPIIGGETLTRFYALHVFVLPALLGLVLSVHLYLVLKLGISAPPVPGERVDPATEDAEYRKKVEAGEPFAPDALYKDGVFSLVAVLVVVVLALVFGPHGPSEPPDPTLANADPRPDWYFLPLFALMSVSPESVESVLMIGLPIVAFLALAAVPFVDRTGERHFSRRPIAVVLVLLGLLSFAGFMWLGIKAPWSPDMTAWSGTPVPEDMVAGRSPLQMQGAVVLQNKDCRNCHALEGAGGHRGPDLTDVAVRLTRDELVRQVIQGGGDMPAYGKQLKPAEVEALVAFLTTLHPEGQVAAHSADKAAK